MWPLAFVFGGISKFAGILFGSELGRAVLIAGIAYFAGHHFATQSERESCQRAAATSRATAASIDARAGWEAAQAAQKQKAASDARARAAEIKLKELADEVGDSCPITPGLADKLNSLHIGGPAGRPAEPPGGAGRGP